MYPAPQEHFFVDMAELYYARLALVKRHRMTYVLRMHAHKLILPTGEGGKKPMSLRLPRTVIERIDALAKARRLTRTDVVLLMLRFCLDEQLGVARVTKGKA